MENVEIAFPAYLLTQHYNGQFFEIVLEERRALGPPRVLPYAPEVGPSREIIRGPSDRRFAITWKVVAYAVRGDAYPKAATEPAGRKSLRLVQDDTDFMRFVRATCNTAEDYVNAVSGNLPPSLGGPPFKPLQHWRVVCNECSFDVASVGPPTIEELLRT